MKKDWEILSNKEKNEECKKMGLKVRYPLDFTCPPTRGIAWIDGRYRLYGDYTPEEIEELDKKQKIELRKVENHKSKLLAKRIEYLGY